MRRPLRTLGATLSFVSIVFAATACQADGDDAADGTPIEEPSSVTDATDEPSRTDASSTNEQSTSEESTDDDAPTTTLVPMTQPPDKSSAPGEPIEPSTEPVYEAGTIDRGLTPFVDRAVADLATRLDIEPDAIEVLTAVLVTWPDGSLGCPEPDMMYATVLTDGSVIELGAGDLVYRYHSGGDRPPFPCDLPLDPVPEPMVGSSS